MKFEDISYNFNVAKVLAIFMVVTGHYLKYDGSYAEDLMLEPTPIGCSVVKLYPATTGNHQRKIIEPYFFT